MSRPGILIAALISLGVAGCSGAVFTPMDQEAQPIVGPAPRLNTTPMAPALACMRQFRNRNLRVGVSDLVDGTGVMEGGTQNSRALSQRPDMMMVVALAATGAHLVNRSSVNVAEWEMNKAMEKKLGDGRQATVDNQRVNFRPIRAGVLLGSTHYVTGAITELNWNIDSGVAEAGAYSAALGRRTYRISIAVDIVVTDTQTTEIVHARSYKKQLVGMETNANFFRFFARDSVLKAIANGNAAAKAVTDTMELFNANLGEKQNEPVQTALRWVIELAAYDVMRTLGRTGPRCDEHLPPYSLDEPAFAFSPTATGGARSAPISARADALQEQPSNTAVASEPTPQPSRPQAVAASTAPAPAEPAARPTPTRTVAKTAPAQRVATQRAERPASVELASLSPAGDTQSLGTKALGDEGAVTEVASAENASRGGGEPRFMSGALRPLEPTFNKAH